MIAGSDATRTLRRDTKKNGHPKVAVPIQHASARAYFLLESSVALLALSAASFAWSADFSA